MFEKIALLYLAIIIVWGIYEIYKVNKLNKLENKLINDIVTFNIDNINIYNIDSINKAKCLMTDIQLDYYECNDVPIILQGRVEDIRKLEDYIKVEIIGSSFYSRGSCKFKKNDKLIDLHKGQTINVKGYLKLYPILALKDCELA